MSAAGGGAPETRNQLLTMQEPDQCNYLYNGMQGEMTLAVQGFSASETTAARDDEGMQEFLQELIDAGMQPSQAGKIVSSRLGLPRGRVYEVAMRLAGVQR